MHNIQHTERTHMLVHLPSSPQSAIFPVPQQLQTLTVGMNDWVSHTHPILLSKGLQGLPM